MTNEDRMKSVSSFELAYFICTIKENGVGSFPLATWHWLKKDEDPFFWECNKQNTMNFYAATDDEDLSETFGKGLKSLLDYMDEVKKNESDISTAEA